MNRVKFKKMIKEYKDASKYEIYEGVRDNFVFGFLGYVAAYGLKFAVVTYDAD